MSHTSSKKAARRRGNKHNRRKGVYMATYKRYCIHYYRHYYSNVSLLSLQEYFAEQPIPTAVMRLK